VVISDPDRSRSTRFLLAKAAASTGRPPTADDLELTPRALQPLDYEELARLLHQITRERGRHRWYRAFDPEQEQFLVGHQLLTGNWRTALYDELERLTGERPPNGTAEQLVMHDPWLDEAFIIPEEWIDDAYHVVLVVTGGIEFPTGLDGRQALVNFWHKLLVESQRSGLLPVVVLGPTKVDPQHQELADQLWRSVAELVAERHVGVPVIDLRPVGRADFARFKPGQAALSTRMLAEGYDELRRRIHHMQDAREQR